MPSGYKSKKNPVLHVPDPMLVTGVLTTGDRYHSKVADLQGFVAVQISGANKIIILILVGGVPARSAVTTLDHTAGFYSF